MRNYHFCIAVQFFFIGNNLTIEKTRSFSFVAQMDLVGSTGNNNIHFARYPGYANSRPILIHII